MHAPPLLFDLPLTHTGAAIGVGALHGVADPRVAAIHHPPDR